MTRARDLSKLSNSQVFSVDSDFQVGINSTVPAATLDVRGDSVITGILTATSFSGTVDATGLTGSPSITVTDITASGNVSIAGTLTYEDVTNIDAVGVITAQSDVVIADKIIHLGDTNTAIRFPAADTFTVETGGSERLRVDSGGQLGIGTASVNANLQVHNSSANATLAINNGTVGPALTDGLTLISATDGSAFIAQRENADLIISTNNTERARIDSSGRLLLGTTTEGEASADDLTIANSGDCGLTIRSGTSSKGKIFFSDGTSGLDESRGYVQYEHTDNVLRFGTDAVEAARFDSSQRLLIGSTLAVNTNAHATLQLIEDDGPQFIFARNDVTTTTNEDIGLIRFYGNDSDGNYDECARIAVEAESAHASDSKPTFMRFMTTAASAESPTERLRITSGGLVGINVNNPTNTLHVVDTNGTDGSIDFGSTSNRGRLYASSSGIFFGSTTSHAVILRTGNTERARIDTSGRLGIGTDSSFNGGILCVGSGQGTNSPSGEHIKIAPNADRIEFLDSSSNASDTGSISLWNTVYNNRSADIELYHPAANTGGIKFSTHDGTSLTERMSIDNLGNVFMTTTSGGQEALTINRQAADGTLISFEQGGTFEGNIAVSGSTVSYNGGHLSRWSQTLTTDEHVGLLKGTVMTNLNEMCQWVLEARDEVLWTEEDTLPEGVSVGDVRFPAQAAGFEDNEQLNKMAVSSVEGDPNVAGVMVNIDDDGDLNVAMTGDMVIRIAQGTTVARGDLLMSAGDGTAKPQGDDIVRSKTIAKVTSTTKSVTYSDGSYCVPCVLMAC